MRQQKSLKQLSKLIGYILGRKPDEFGLVTDPDGFVKIKELLKAICEEDTWKYVRRAHIEEILITLPNPLIEIKENRIRATDRDNLPDHALAANPPKLLYTCVRRKAHPMVMEKGIFPMGHPHVILSSSRDMAERMGKRSDRMPVVLTINTTKMVDQRESFYRAGDSLYLAATVPPGCFTGPPAPKQKAEVKKDASPEVEKKQRLSGSFLIDFTNVSDPKRTPPRRKKSEKIAREKAIKQRQRQKRKMWES